MGSEERECPGCLGLRWFSVNDHPDQVCRSCGYDRLLREIDRQKNAAKERLKTSIGHERIKDIATLITLQGLRMKDRLPEMNDRYMQNIAKLEALGYESVLDKNETVSHFEYILHSRGRTQTLGSADNVSKQAAIDPPGTKPGTALGLRVEMLSEKNLAEAERIKAGG